MTAVYPYHRPTGVRFHPRDCARPTNRSVRLLLMRTVLERIKIEPHSSHAPTGGGHVVIIGCRSTPTK